MTIFSRNNQQMNKLSTGFDNIVNELKKQHLWIPFEGQCTIKRLKSFFYACAICHNMNWEFLCNSAIPKLETKTNGFDLDKITNLSVEDIEDLFYGYDKQYKIEANRRLEMLVLLAEELQNENNFFEDLINSSSLKGNDGFLIKLDNFSVYNGDPLRKKSNLLAQLCITSGLITVIDEYELDPPIDYHIMRVYLRTRRVSIKNKEFIKRLLGKDDFSLDEITELRENIRELMKAFCIKHKKSIIQLGFVDWVVGREYCNDDSPMCNDCPISNACISAGISADRMLIEPKSNHEFY